MKAKWENSAATMKAQLLKLGRSGFTGKILGSPWNRIPAVSNVRIETQDYNHILRQVGVKKKLPAQIEFRSNSANKMNRYIAHQILRLRRHKETRLYWRIVGFMLTRSVSFRVSAINHVLPSWWYSWRFDDILMINNQVSKIFGKSSGEVQSRRVYIEKANGKWRPLGVPSAKWRIALHMMNCVITEALMDRILSCQHAYLPGKGTTSAWRDVIQNILDKQNIYETDLKGFFDNVKLMRVDAELEKGKVPKQLRNWLWRVNETVPKLPRVEKLPETKRRPSIFDTWELMESRGVAQGAPTSPFLAILTLREYLSQSNLTCVNYADDQIFASNEEFEVKDNPKNGIIHAEEKCGWIRKNGIWIKELKFLGLVYNPWDDTLRSETRSERSIRIGDDLMELWDEIKYDKRKSGLYDMSKRNIFAFVQSCLYNGTFAPEVVWKDEPEANRFSWLSHYKNSKTLSSMAVIALAEAVKKTMWKRKKTKS